MERETDVVLSIHLVEDDIETVAIAKLDLRGDHFEARGRARRNPIDPVKPLIGEELAIARGAGRARGADHRGGSGQDRPVSWCTQTDSGGSGGRATVDP